MKGTEKLFAVLTVLVFALGFVPLLAQQLPYEGLDWLKLQSAMYYGDSYEPDSRQNHATYIPVNGPWQMRDFHVTGDRDWVWFDAQMGSSYGVHAQATPLGSQADTEIWLYDAFSSPIAYDDDGGSGFDAWLRFTATHTGVYWAKVTEWASRSGDDFFYRLRVTTIYSTYLPLTVRRGP